MARLIVTEGPELGTEFELARPEAGVETLLLGRDPHVAVALNDSAVSREHCRIEATPRGFRLVDLGSRNRTYLDGEPIANAWLSDGQTLSVGDSELRFEDDAPPVESYGVASTIIKELSSARRWKTGDASAALAERSDRPDDDGQTGTAEEPSAAQLKRIIAIASRASSAETSRKLLTQLLGDLADELDCDRAAFLVRSKRSWTVALERAEGQDAARPPGSKAARVDLEVVGHAAKERKALLAVSSVGDGGSGARPTAGGEPGSLLAAAIESSEDLSGVLYLERSASRPAFLHSDLELVQAIVEPIGVALARLGSESELADAHRSLVRSLSETRRIVGDSQAVHDVMSFIERAAPTPMTVLIVGETGTGKELVASAVHFGSPRRGKPFVALNCAALPETLVESELFGHERGAFTGAVARKKGRFELASGGTVFLDEVGELSLSCQAKLLRLLEERRFERVGGVDTVEVDVRIIAATNRDLLDMVEKGEFREDLYYRLGVLQVKIPPLRERPEDIALLVAHFLAQHRIAGQPKKLSKSAERKLTKYSWPGNVRQLRNVIESAIVLGQGREITESDLTLPERRLSDADGWTPSSLQELERKHVLRVLEHTGGNKKRAAEILGIERCTLYSKLKSYGP